eukprot:6472001-Amphidinium_carterae.1
MGISPQVLHALDAGLPCPHCVSLLKEAEPSSLNHVACHHQATSSAVQEACHHRLGLQAKRWLMQSCMQYYLFCVIRLRKCMSGRAVKQSQMAWHRAA